LRLGRIKDKETLSRLQKLKLISIKGFFPLSTYLQKSSTEEKVKPLLFDKFKRVRPV